MLTAGGNLSARLQRYASWLHKQALAVNTKRSYAVQVPGCGELLLGYMAESGTPLSSADERDYAVRHSKAFSKRQSRRRTTTLALTAICHFHQFVGFGDAGGHREDLPRESLRASWAIR